LISDSNTYKGGIHLLDNNYTGITKLKDWWGKVKANFAYLDDRISTIITTPVDGVSAQEIIDARKGELALGDKIDAMDLEVSTHLADNVSVKDAPYNAKGDGITDDTAAIQACINANNGKTIYFPAGIYKAANISIPPYHAINIKGAGADTAIFIPTDNDISIFKFDQGFAETPKRISDVGFKANGKTGCKGIEILKGRNVTLENLSFTDVKYGIDIDRCFVVTIHNIWCTGPVGFRFYASDITEESTSFIMDLTIDKVQHDVSLSDWGTSAWFTFERLVNSYVSNITARGLRGTCNGIEIKGRCEGILFTNVILPWAKTGIKLQSVGGEYPGGIEMNNFSVDQFVEDGASIDGRWVWMNNCSFLNGVGRDNTGSGIEISATSQDIKMNNVRVNGNNYDGIKINSGATGIQMNNVNAFGNGYISGYDIHMEAGATPSNPQIANSSFGTSRIIGQLADKRKSTNNLYLKAAITSTPASTVETTLGEYIIPANTVDINNKLKIKAFGNTAGNTNIKTIKLYLGNDVIGLITGAINGQMWDIESEVLLVNLTSQLICTKHTQGATSHWCSNYLTGGIFTSPLTIKLTGQNGTAVAADIQLVGMSIELV
jgi:hypothetical protein